MRRRELPDTSVALPPFCVEGASGMEVVAGEGAGEVEVGEAVLAVVADGVAGEEADAVIRRVNLR